MVGGRIHPRPTWAGKAATFFQIVTVLTGMLARYFHWSLGLSVFIWLAAAFTVVSGLQYLLQGMRFLNATAAERDEADEHVFLR